MYPTTAVLGTPAGELPKGHARQESRQGYMRLEMKRRKAGCKKKPLQNACWNRNICTTEAPQGVLGHETPRLTQSSLNDAAGNAARAQGVYGFRGLN